MSYAEGWIGTNSWRPNGINWVEPIWKWDSNTQLNYTMLKEPEYKIFVNDSVLKVTVVLPQVKGSEINAEVKDKLLILKLDTESPFIELKEFGIDLGYEVIPIKGILEYGVLTLTFDIVDTKKTIKIEEK